MNTVEKLLKADKGLLEEKLTDKRYSAKLSRLMNEEFKVTIQEIDGRRIHELSDSAKTDYDANLLYCVEGIVDPPLKDKKLMEEFKAATPKDLAEKLLGFEADKIASAIVGLSAGKKPSEKDVKN